MKTLISRAALLPPESLGSACAAVEPKSNLRGRWGPCGHFSAVMLLTLLALPAWAADKSCAERLKELEPIAIRMPYREFDQSPDGWRKLMDCLPESARLLDRYVKKQEYELRGTRWHLAQVKAGLGESQAAAALMRLSLVPDELESRSAFKWNSYALATVAFLEGDKDSFEKLLQEHRNAARADAANQTNLEVLERLRRCWGQPYMRAYGCSSD